MRELALQHLLLRLKPINRLLRLAASRVSQAAAKPVVLDAPSAEMYLTTEEASALLDEVDQLPPWCTPPLPTLDEAERQQEQELYAAAAPELLPLEALRQHGGLTDFELECLLFCAAPEVDRAYERLFAFILDDLNRRAPCVELLCSLTATSATERHLRRHLLASHGRLARTGLIRLGQEVGSEWRRELHLTPEAVQWLFGGTGSVDLFTDPMEAHVEAPEQLVSWGVEEALLDRAVASLRGNPPGAVGIHGPRQSSQTELPYVLAARAGLPLRRLPWVAALATPKAIVEAVQMARALGAALWIQVEPVTAEPAAEERALHVLEELALHGPPLIFSGSRPFRPLGMMAGRPWVELHVASPSRTEAESLWAGLLPEIASTELAGLALRFRLSPSEIRAAVNVYRSSGTALPQEALGRLERACRVVARRRTERLVTVVAPTRTPEDLILPEPIHRGVLDVARFASVWPRVAEEWELGRMHRGSLGVRALFTGPSGTGKTLAAEVIAGMLGQELHKVDLAQLVSKWVGETEKNLDAAFDEAEQSQAVLFFDEGEALFSKRGEVRHGSDRYANLEVSYLLQRLEAYSGLVIVATNLKENLDEAFSRRFHVAVDFPKPTEQERLRLWRLAFPAAVPLEGVDLTALVGLDMTGATIMNAARTAALLAACDGQVVQPAHILEGIAREYQRESRLLLLSELAPFNSQFGGRA